MKVGLVNSRSAVGLRFAFLVLFAGLAFVVGSLLNSAFAALVLTSVMLTATNVFLRQRFGFKAFTNELEGRERNFWGKFELVYLVVAGAISVNLSFVIEPLWAALFFAIPGGFCLAEVFAKAIADRTRSGRIK